MEGALQPDMLSTTHSHAAMSAVMGRACSASRWLGQADACADVGAAKGIGHLVPAGHVPDEVGGVGPGHPTGLRRVPDLPDWSGKRW